ncbi:hypothetical protein H1C39_21010 [Salmonella enterica subsp. enterica serovar Indiana]|nr:hypothetical protein [Salmonella enterica subsp. enterica serovar Indiana]
MQIEKVMSLLEVLSSWLEDNINMDSEIIFDKGIGSINHLFAPHPKYLT